MFLTLHFWNHFFHNTTTVKHGSLQCDSLQPHQFLSYIETLLNNNWYNLWGGTRQVTRVTTNEEAQERQVTRVATNEEAQDNWRESLQMRRHKTSDESHYKWGSTRKTSDESYYKWGGTRQVMRVTTNEEAQERQVMRVTTNEEAQDKWRELLQGRRTTYAACMSQNSNLGAIEVNLTICWIAAENFFASLTLTCDENVAG